MSNTCPESFFSATIRIMDAGHLHEEITQTLGVAPTKCHLKGESRELKFDFLGKHDSDAWKLKSPLPAEVDFSAHLSWLQERLYPHGKYLKRLVEKGARVDVFCGYRCEFGTSRFSIQSESLRMIRDLKLKLEVSVIVYWGS